MPVPTISPRNWHRTRMICALRMGTGLSLVEELSFQDQLLTIIDVDWSYRDEAREMEEKNEDTSATYRSHTDFEATPDDPYQLRQIATQSKAHRPNVDGEVVSQLHEAVKREKPSIPAVKLGFDRNLGTVLDAAERYYNALQCEVHVVNA